MVVLRVCQAASCAGYRPGSNNPMAKVSANTDGVKFYASNSDSPVEKSLQVTSPAACADHYGAPLVTAVDEMAIRALLAATRTAGSGLKRLV